jgi:hypothetical protein
VSPPARSSRSDRVPLRSPAAGRPGRRPLGLTQRATAAPKMPFPSATGRGGMRRVPGNQLGHDGAVSGAAWRRSALVGLIGGRGGPVCAETVSRS